MSLKFYTNSFYAQKLCNFSKNLKKNRAEKLFGKTIREGEFQNREGEFQNREGDF